MYVITNRMSLQNNIVNSNLTHRTTSLEYILLQQSFEQRLI